MEQLTLVLSQNGTRWTPGREDELPSRPLRRAPKGLAATMALTLVAVAVAAPSAEATPVRAAGPTPETMNDTILEERYEGSPGARDYRLRVPEEPPPDGERPLVVMLHGCTQDAADFAAGTRMGERADEEGWLTLFPEQPPRAHPQRCWRWFAPEPPSEESGEAAVLTGLLDEVIAERGVDPGRVYLAGISAGGAMAAVLAATRPDRFAGVAIHSGVPYGAARGAEEAMAAMGGAGPDAGELARRLREALDGRALPPLLVIHGEDDEAVAPVNARRLAAAWLATSGRALPDEFGGSGLLPEPDLDESHAPGAGRPWRLRAWTGPGPRVELRTVEGLGHAWSGGDPAGTYTDPQGPSATSWAVEFFRRSFESEPREARG